MTDIKNSPYLDRPIRTLEQAQADMARSAKAAEAKSDKDDLERRAAAARTIA